MITENVFPNRIYITRIKERDFFLQDGFIECINNAGEILFISNEIGGDYIFECTDLFVHDRRNIKVFNSSNGEFDRHIPGYTLFKNSYINECSVLVYDFREDLPSKLSRLNLTTELPEWTIDFSMGLHNLVEGDSVYLEKDLDKKFLYAIDLKNGNIRWQFDISQFGSYLDSSKREQSYQLLQIVGAHTGLLWVVISGGKLLAIDTKTGHLIHVLDFNEIFGQFYYAGTSQMFLDKDNNRIIWIRLALIHIDLISMKCTVIKEYFEGVQSKERWHFKSKLLHNNKIFFTGDLGMYNLVVPTFIGIMDVNTGEILWNTQLLKCDGIRIGGLNISRNRLFAKDGKRNLHVFEQEIDF